ncbi:MAG: YlxR family protein [Chloroflexota bacterium]
MLAKPKRGKKIPHRTCVGCRTVQPKRTLSRVVRTPEGVQIDLLGKLNGRGAYLHNQPACWEKGLDGSLAHALKTKITDDERAQLNQYMLSLPSNKEK